MALSANDIALLDTGGIATAYVRRHGFRHVAVCGGSGSAVCVGRVLDSAVVPRAEVSPLTSAGSIVGLGLTQVIDEAGRPQSVQGFVERFTIIGGQDGFARCPV